MCGASKKNGASGQTGGIGPPPDHRGVLESAEAGHPLPDTGSPGAGDDESVQPAEPGEPEPTFGYATDGGKDADGNSLIWSTADDAGGRYYRSDTGTESDPA